MMLLDILASSKRAVTASELRDILVKELSLKDNNNYWIRLIDSKLRDMIVEGYVLRERIKK